MLRFRMSLCMYQTRHFLDRRTQRKYKFTFAGFWVVLKGRKLIRIHSVFLLFTIVQLHLFINKINLSRRHIMKSFQNEIQDMWKFESQVYFLSTFYSKWIDDKLDTLKKLIHNYTVSNCLIQKQLFSGKENFPLSKRNFCLALQIRIPCESMRHPTANLLSQTSFSTISNSVRFGRSRRGLLLSAFVGVNYLMKCTHSSKGQPS